MERGEWRLRLEIPGVQCVTISGIKMTQKSCADHWDTLQGNIKHLQSFDLKCIICAQDM